VRTLSMSTDASVFGESPANKSNMDKRNATAAQARGRIAVARMVTMEALRAKVRIREI
jgi:hypothetical protein